MGMTERDARLVLLLTPGLGQTLAGRCLAAFGSAASTVEADVRSLAAIRDIGGKTAATIRRAMDDILNSDAVAREHALLDEHQVRLLSSDEPDYPDLLRHTSDAPLLLFVRGDFVRADALALALVGARKCSHYGREQADRFAYQLAQSGLTIVSGGAYGIDASAHRAALRAQGRTLAVLGSGLAKPYPSDHAELFDQIVADGRGAVISEFPMATPPRPTNFPRRNRIISGLALGVVVIEAGRRSGALITARLCVEEHGRECMALPGRVDSPQAEGCHKILREGWATLVTSPAEVLDQLGEAGQTLALVPAENRGERSQTEDAAPSLFDAGLTPSQRAVIDAMDSPRSLDQLSAWTNLPVQVIQADLTLLEIRGLVKRQSGLFRRARR